MKFLPLIPKYIRMLAPYRLKAVLIEFITIPLLYKFKDDRYKKWVLYVMNLLLMTIIIFTWYSLTVDTYTGLVNTGLTILSMLVYKLISFILFDVIYKYGIKGIVSIANKRKEEGLYKIDVLSIGLGIVLIETYSLVAYKDMSSIMSKSSLPLPMSHKTFVIISSIMLWIVFMMWVISIIKNKEAHLSKFIIPILIGLALGINLIVGAIRFENFTSLGLLMGLALPLVMGLESSI